MATKTRNYLGEETSPQMLFFYENIGDDLENKSLRDVISALDKICGDMESKGWQNIRVDIPGCYDESYGFTLHAERMETDKECDDRNDRAAERYRMDQSKKREQYELLKKEFGND
jgi:hypothetical protein